jgi:hypothetical protein
LLETTFIGKIMQMHIKCTSSTTDGFWHLLNIHHKFHWKSTKQRLAQEKITQQSI